MTNQPKLSARSVKALEVLVNGGRFVKRLERDSYTGREQFHTRLVATRSWQSVVCGVGFSTFHELEKHGMLAYCSEEGTSVSSYWKLSTN